MSYVDQNLYIVGMLLLECFTVVKLTKQYIWKITLCRENRVVSCHELGWFPNVLFCF